MAGLKAEDFAVLVGGAAADVVDVVEVNLAENVGPDLQKPRSLTASMQRGERRRFVLFLDLAMTNFRAWRNARSAAVSFVEHFAHPDDLLSLAIYSPRRGLLLAVPFTLDHAVILDALAGERETAGFDAAPEFMDGVPINAIAQLLGTSDVARAIEDMERERLRGTYENYAMAFVGLGRLLAAVEGRKQVLLLSSGVDDEAFGYAEFVQIMVAAAEQFVAANAVVHGFNPDTMPVSDVHDVSRINGRPRSSVPQFEVLRNRELLNFIADETGGKNSWFRHNLRKGFDAVAVDTARYYVLSIALPRGQTGPVPVDIQVRADGASTRWSSRFVGTRSNANDPTAAVRALRLAEALELDSEASEMSLRVATARLYPNGGLGGASIAFEVPQSEVRRLWEGADGELAFEVMALAISPGGAIVDFFTDRLRLRGLESIDSDSSPAFKYRNSIVAPSGTYAIKLLVREAYSGTLASRTLRLEIPDAEPEGLWISDPMLIEDPRGVPGLAGRHREEEPPGHRSGYDLELDPFTVGSRSLTPSANTTLRPGNQSYLFLVARNFSRTAGTGTPALELSLHLGGENSPPTSASDVAILDISSLPNGAFRMLVAFTPPGASPSGPQRLHAVVRDSIAAVEVSASITVTVVHGQ